MAREPDSIVRIAASGEQPDQIVGVVGDQVITATPSDVGKVVTVAADGSLVLAAAGGGGVTDHGDLTGLAADDHPYILETLIDAADDLIVGSAADTAARLAVAASRIIGKKATGGIGALTAAEVLAILGIAAPKMKRIVRDGAGTLTTTSTTKTPIDATNLGYLTFDLAVGDVVKLLLAATTANSSGANVMGFDYEVDRPTSANVYVGNTNDYGVISSDGNRKCQTIVATFIATEAGVHGFRPVWVMETGTGKMHNATSSYEDTLITYIAEHWPAALVS